MREYIVFIDETAVYRFPVMANSEEEAESKGLNQFLNSPDKGALLESVEDRHVEAYTQEYLDQDEAEQSD